MHRPPSAPRVTPELISCRLLRRAVGVLGVALPFVLLGWGLALDPPRILPSVSAHASEPSRSVLVGMVFAISTLLFAYRGYDLRDEVAGKLACALGLGVALLPGTRGGWQRVVHELCAALLFGVLAYFSLCLFTRSVGVPTPEKRIRNATYRICGGTILACVGLITAIPWLLDAAAVARWRPVFWLETVALVAFGSSWLVKGETVFRDRPAAG